MRTGRGKVVWGYLVEVLLTALICLLGWRAADVGDLVTFFHNTANSWMVLIGAMFTFNAALFVVFVQSLTTDFGGWLKWRGGDRVYKTACIWVLIIDLIAFMALIVMGYHANGIIGVVTIAWLVYTIVNEVTFVRNVMEVVGLNQEFRLARSHSSTIMGDMPVATTELGNDDSPPKLQGEMTHDA